MSINLELPKLTELRPRLTVIGVGGAGCNAVNNMIAAGLHGVEFVVANTDAQALAASSAEHRIQLGAHLTEGLGAGSRPEIGNLAAEEAIDDIRAQVSGSHMVFVAAGMGGGTGTGAASVIARAAREQGILTVGIVTKPFHFEGARRMRIAEAGVAELRKHVDTLIVIPNQNLFRIANERTTFAEAFVLADQVLYSGVACIVDLVVKEGLINLDFADVRTVMSGMGTAMMGTGEASGERRAIVAAEEAICNPLLDEVSLKGATGLLLSITGGEDLTLYEVDEAASRVRQEVDPEANIIVGATYDESLGDRVRVSIVASGMARNGEGRPKVAAAVPPPLGTGELRPGWPPAAREMPPALPGSKPAAQQHQHHQEADHELQRRLAHAMQQTMSPAHEHAHSGAPNATHPHARGFEPQPAAAQARPQREAWRGPGNVMIEEGLPQFAHAGAPVAPRTRDHSGNGSGYSHGYEAGAGSGQTPGYDPDRFEPAAPSELVRRPQRMPVEESYQPANGHRGIHAKVAGALKFPGGARAIGGSGQSQKKGLLERITGIGWGGGGGA